MYKLIYNGQVIDVVRHPSFIKFLTSGHIAMTDQLSADGIVGSDYKTAYSFTQIPERDDVLVVSIEQIDVDEFNRLTSLLNSADKANKVGPKVIRARESLITALSEICRTKITDGFSITLRGRNSYNFKLTTEDQLNLLSLENQLNAGAETFVYHGTGLPCEVFTREDMQKIVKAYRKHVCYHTTYFNVAKQYIQSLTDINKINTFVYGTDIAGMTQDLQIREILRAGGSN